MLQLEADPFYASPEQCRGGDKDSRALVYSIGVLLFERLTGHHPFVEALSREGGRAPTGTGPNNLCSLPGELRTVLNRAMSAFPDERYRDVAELSAALELYLGRADTVIAPLPTRAGLGSQSHPRISTSAETVLRPRRRSTPPPCPGSADRAIFDMVRRSTTHSGLLTPRVPATPPPIPARALRRRKPERRPPSRRPLVAAGILTAASCVVLIWAAARMATNTQHATAATPRAKAPAPTQPAPAKTNLALPVEEPRGATFDADVAGNNALAEIRDCFTDYRLRRGVQVGATLRFHAHTGLSDQVFFGSGSRLSRRDRACVTERLKGIEGLAAPDDHTMVTYLFRLSEYDESYRILRRR